MGRLGTIIAAMAIFAAAGEASAQCVKQGDELCQNGQTYRCEKTGSELTPIFQNVPCAVNVPAQTLTGTWVGSGHQSPAGDAGADPRAAPAGTERIDHPGRSGQLDADTVVLLDRQFAGLIDHRRDLLGTGLQDGRLAVPEVGRQCHDRQDADHRDDHDQLGKGEARLVRRSRAPDCSHG